MPTKKRRVGFIPRNEVLDLINKLSYESNLSYSKIINILVEEALYKRGLFNLKKDKSSSEKLEYKEKIANKETKRILIQEFNHILKNKLFNEENVNFKEIKVEPFDNEIYAKFLLFLQFQERMKKTDT